MENVLRLDLHALIPRFAALRLHDPAPLGRLKASIARESQLVPVVAVPEAGHKGHLPTSWCTMAEDSRMVAK